MALTDRINGWARKIPAWPIYVIAVFPIVWVFWAGISGQLGPEPVKAIEHRLGLWGLQVLIASLLITPARTYLKLNLIKYRRAIGLVAFFYILAHLLVWLILDVQWLSEIWKDILKRPYITVGMAGFVLLIPLAITSNDLSIRKMGAAAWRKMHKLVYGAVILGGVHYLMQAKGFQIQPIVYLLVIVGLLALRVKLNRKRTRAPVA